MIDPIYSLVFSTAFLGSGHCIGMCGPLVAAFSLQEPGWKQIFFFHTLYNAGRLTTYTAIGLCAGWIGSLLNTTQTFSLFSQGILLLGDTAVILLGLKTSGICKGFPFLPLVFPQGSGLITTTINKLRTLPIGKAVAFPIGLTMGFLPCGFLYAIALAAAGRGSALEGGAILFVFGLGTIPALFLFGSSMQILSTTMRQELLRWAGILVICIGAYNFYDHLG